MNTVSSHPRLRLWTAALVLAVAPAWLAAQGIYRIVGPDGKVSFSDKPPATQDKVTPLSPGGRAPSADGGGSGDLPFELRQVIARYPVTLYTGDNCEPCNAGRSLLNSRGVPFTERTIKTAKDIEALQRMGIQPSVPALTIGGQQVKGFLDSEWNDYLNAAGYPQTSRLPSGYRNPPAQALVPATEAEAPRAAAPAAPTTPDVASPPPPSPSNPTGIIF